MPPAAALLAVLTVLLGLLGPLGAPAHADDAPSDPLSVTINDIDAATINGSGPITVSGTITNEDDTAWSDVHVYPFLGDTPITSEKELAEAASLPEDTYVGQRIIVDDHYATIDDLDPGETTSWSLTLPRKYLRAKTSGPGIYWFGVHALGPTPLGEMPTADGRARTFLPLLDRDTKKERKKLRRNPERVAVVLPIRRRVIHQPDGRIANVAAWTRDLGDDGRLGRLLSFGSTSTDVSWLLDPAVLDAARRLAAGNPGRNLGPTDGDDSDGSSPSASPSPGASYSPGSSDTNEVQGDADDDASEDAATSTDKATAAAATAAQRWLDRLHSVLGGHEVLALPYADPDLPAVAQLEPGLYDEARARADAVLSDLDIDADPAVAPPSGYLDTASLKLLDDHPLTLVSDRMIKGADPAVASVGGHRLVTTSAAAASGGPEPWPTSVVGLRQRIVSEASLRIANHRPLVVVLPDTLRPDGISPAFFNELESADWLKLTTVAGAVRGRTARPVTTDQLVYPDSEASAQLPVTVFSAVDDLIRSGRTLQRILLRNDQVATEVLEEALASTSYSARRGRGEAAARSAEHIGRQLDDIHVEVPPRVALSSAKGRFSVTVDNDLDEPVTVRIRPVTDSGLKVSVPDPLQIPAGGRTTQLLNAVATTNGAHSVRIVLTDSVGTRVGTTAELPLRTGQVSTIIWWFVGVGCALLFGAIAVRLVRRFRAARRSGRTPGATA